MKKFYYSLFAAASMMLAVTSCSQEEDFVQSSSEMTTFSVQLDGATQSRTAGDGKTVDKLYYAVYSESTGEVVYPAGAQYGTAKKEDGGWKLDLPLMKSETYDILFWAQKDGSGAYEFTNLKEVTVKYDGVLSNKEDRDAFFNALDGFKASGSEHTIVLRRPFAQLNVATTIDDWTKAKTIYNSTNNTTGVNPVSKSAVTVSALATKFNVLTGEASVPTTGRVTFGANTLLDESIKIKRMVEGVEKDVEYKLLAMNYLLPKGTKKPNGLEQYNPEEGKENTEVEFTLYKGTDDQIVNVKVPATPIQRNWRTNIIGDLLTGEGFDVVIEEGFDNEENQEIEISADGIVKDADGIYHITTTEGLWNLARLVNNGSQSASTGGRAATVGYTFEGETFVLDCDIDLAGAEWTPIGSNGAMFSGTFDGNGKTVSNFKVDVEEMGGLFGNVRSAKIKNLKVQTANIKSTHFAGGIAAHGVCAKITGCTVEDITITVNPNVKIGNDFNGDKAGGIIGYLCADGGDASLMNCKANKVTITAYRDFGGIVGYTGKSEGYTNNPTISGNSVGSEENSIVLVIDNSHNYKNYTELSQYNVGEIIGRNNGATGENTTPADEAVQIVFTGADQYPGYYQDAEGNYIATEDLGITNLIKEGVTDINLADGQFVMSQQALGTKTYTISGSRNANLDMTAFNTNGNQSASGATLKIEGITLSFKTNENYNGFTHTNEVSLKDCAIQGNMFLYSPTTFENCDFNSNGAEHCVWTYGATKATFKGCDFTYGDRAVNCYSEAGASHEANVTFTDCTFTKVAGAETTGAIETNSSSIKSLALNINNCSVNEGDLWWVSEWDSKNGENTVSTIDGKRIVTTNGQLKAAVAEGLAKINLTEGTFTMPTALSGKTIVLEGTDKEKTIIDMTHGGTPQYGAESVTFKNLTMKRKADWLGGFSHSNAEHYEDCIIEGTLVTYAPTVTAKRTNFVPAATEYYNVHIYSPGTIKFEECNFRTTRGRSIYAHHDTNASTYDITINKCNFTTGAMEESDSQNQAAIRLHTEYGINGKLTINECTATGWKATHNGGLWVEWNNGTKAYTNLFEKKINGLTYVSEGVWKDAEGNYVVTNGDELNATIKAAVANSTIKLLAGTYEGVEMAGQIASGLTIQGTEDAIVKGIKCNFSNATLEGMTFKNVYFENKGIYFEEITGAPWDFVKNFTMTECVMTGIGNNQDVVGNRLFDLGTDSPGSNQFENIIIENCKVSNVIQGIRLGALRGACIIKGNEISNIGHNGITLRSVQEGTVLVEGNKISNGSDRAFRIGSNSGSVTYKNNTIVNCGDTVDGSNFKANTLGTVTFEGNTVDGNAWNPLS